MEDKVLPIIFINLCGEMLYVILQRLDAQNISPEKTAKVIQDILSTMLNDQFLEELFKPQKMYTRLAMQSVFEKLVHSSIMRLNSNSMSKLYDLMLMVFKYQVVNCQQPSDVLFVTVNHLDAVKDCARPHPDLLNKVKNIYSLLISNYSKLYQKDYECLYKCIGAFLSDLNIRVSVLMKLGLQLPSGELVIAHNDPDLLQSEAEAEEYQQCISLQDFEFEGVRSFTLGTNIYLQAAASEPTKNVESQLLSSTSQINQNEKDVKGMDDLNLLTRLIGKCTASNCMPEIMLTSNDEERGGAQVPEAEESSVVNIDASRVSEQNLEKICKDLVINIEERQKFDILELLDTVETNDT